MAVIIDGPRLAPRSQAAGQLIVLLHGYGANGNDLIPLGQQWRALLPDAAFVAPHAPEPCPEVPGRRQWFRLTMRSAEERWTGVNKAQPALDAFLDAELNRWRLDDSKLALVGFSQGAMMALHTGLRRSRPPAAILAYSGLLAAPEQSNPVPAIPPGLAPPILLIHGSEDDLIPADALFVSAEMLAEAGVPCQWHLCPGLGHGIDSEGLRHGGLFLTSCFGLRPRPRPGSQAS